MKNLYIFFPSALLIALSPLIHSKTAIYGTTVYSTVYFWTVIDISFIIYILLSNKSTINLNHLQISLLVYLTINFLSAIFGHDIRLNLLSNFERMSGFLSMLHLILYFYLFSQVDLSKKQLNMLILAILSVGLIINLIGIIGVFNGKHFRAESILANPMHLSIYAIIQFYLIIYSFSIWKNYPAKFILTLLILVTIVSLTLTQTRAGILSLLAGLSFIAIFYFLKSEKKIRFILYVTLGLVILSGLLTLSYYSEISIFSRFSDFNLKEDTIWVRLKLWKMCLNNSLEKPFLGWGQGSFIYFYFKNFTSDLNNAGFWYDSAHNEFIDKIIGTGYIGLLSYLWLIFLGFYGIWKKNTNYLAQFEKVILSSFLITYIIFMFFGFDSLFSLIAFFTVFILVNKNFSPIHHKSLFQEKQLLIKIGVIIPLVMIIYFGSYKTIITNKMLSLAYSEKIAEKKIELYSQTFDNAIIGKYDVALQFTLQRSLFLNATIPPNLREEYFKSSNQTLNEALNIHTDNPILLNQLGFLKSDYGLSAESIKIFEKMNQMSPNRLINNHDYAWLLFKNNQISKSFDVIDNVIQKQSYNQKAILLKTRFLLERKNYIDAFKTLNKFDSKETIKYFKDITDLVFEYQVYNEFYDFLYQKYHSNLDDFKLTDEQLLIWSEIAQLSKNKKQVFSVFSYYAGNTLLGDNSQFRNKKDSLRVLELINMVHEGKANYDVILSLKDFD